MSDKPSMVERYFPTEASRRRASAELIREAESILATYDPEIVGEVRRRREAGESFREIFHAMNRHPDVPGIGMQLAVIQQALQIRKG
jgi:hypothetical protein